MEMAISRKEQIEHITPDEEELKPYHLIKCTEANCLSVFYNRSHFVLHMQKHHKIAVEAPTNSQRICWYYCPVSDCRYNLHCKSGKHFKILKYVRQHYQKMHMERSFPCGNCDKAFITNGKLKIHMKTVCGQKFPCLDCVWAYDSREALLTHGKRKSHNVRCKTNSTNILNKVAIMPLKSAKYKSYKVKQYKQTKEPRQQKQSDKLMLVQQQYDKSAQLTQLTHHAITTNTIETHVRRRSTELMEHQHFEIASPMNGVNNVVDQSVAAKVPAFLHQDLGDISTILRDIETQTEPQQQQQQQQHPSSSNNPCCMNQMLAQSSHMYTQTCNDILREIVLSDIETQTNWSEAKPYMNNGLFVSAETQTTFNPNDYGSLSHTQCTQTCAQLLQGFEFSTPEELNDLLPTNLDNESVN